MFLFLLLLNLTLPFLIIDRELSINISVPITAKKIMYIKLIIRSMFPDSLKNLKNTTPKVDPKIPPIKRNKPIS